MTIYFAFSDENGSYKRVRGKRFIRAHKYYVRATCIIDATEWKNIESAYCALKRKHGIPIEKEVKWSFARSLHKYKEDGKEIREKEAFYFLREKNPEALQDFLREALALLVDLNYCNVIFTVTSNERCRAIAHSRLIKMHLQEAMQRIQMDMEDARENLCVFFVDPVSNENDKNLREAYSELYRGGDLYKRYSHIKDSLNVEHSHHSVGIQMADFLAGAFVANLKEYEMGQEVYRDCLSRIIRRGPGGRLPGFGFREVPRDVDLRAELGARCT